MRCPFCNSMNTQVRDSRPAEEHAAIRRRRFCPDCGGRFTTFERVQLREITVVKNSGRKVPFEREKLERSIRLAARKRPVTPEQISALVSTIVRQLESGGETEVPSSTIGAVVMDALRDLDGVAYVRFASVYKDFAEVSDFQTVLGELAKGATVSTPADDSAAQPDGNAGAACEPSAPDGSAPPTQPPSSANNA